MLTQEELAHLPLLGHITVIQDVSDLCAMRNSA